MQLMKGITDSYLTWVAAPSILGRRIADFYLTWAAAPSIIEEEDYMFIRS